MTEAGNQLADERERPRREQQANLTTSAILTAARVPPIDKDAASHQANRKTKLHRRAAMVSIVGLLVVAGIPTTIGVCEALSAQKKANAAAKEKAKFYLTATVSLDGENFDECYCILEDGRVWIDHPDAPVSGHKFNGWYFGYPSEEKHLGLVSTISDNPPALNWMFVDKDTHMVRHGSRQDTLGHIIGPWGWSDDEQWLTLEGHDDSFVAVEQETGNWCVFYDKDGKIQDDGEDTDEEEGEGSDDETGEGGEARKSKKPKMMGDWLPVKLHRKMVLGMDSKYVKGPNAK